MKQWYDALWLGALFGLTGLLAAAPESREGKSPDRELPPHITRLTLFGERADFSHDGRRVLFLAKTFGDVFELDLATKALRLVTGVRDFVARHAELFAPK